MEFHNFVCQEKIEDHLPDVKKEEKNNNQKEHEKGTASS